MNYSEAHAENDHAHHVELMGVLERIATALEKWGGAVAHVLHVRETGPDLEPRPLPLCGLPYIGRDASCMLPLGHTSNHFAKDQAGAYSWEQSNTHGSDYFPPPKATSTKPLDGARCPYRLTDWPAAGRMVQCVRRDGHEGEHEASYFDPEKDKGASVSW